MKREQLAALKAAIQADPTLSSLGHVGIVEALRTHDRDVPAETIDIGALVANIAKADRLRLSVVDKDHLAFLVSASGGTLPLTPTLKADLAEMFNSPSATKTNIERLFKRKGSRLDELGLPNVTESDVADALRT